ncbi:MAG: T9SS type A sorting domain-containing protein [Candidatus Cloacimonetes bacterium]|nr:T9SS type A sorting domain-containing protein [Candidatus Cloacimonadota bacterium]
MKFKYIIFIFFIVILFKHSYCYQLNNGEFYSSTEYTVCDNFQLIGLFTPYGTNEGFIGSGNFQLFALPNICLVGIYDDQIVEFKNFIRNHPNPFNPETTISFSLQNNSNVELSIYNIKGQKVKTLINGFREAGYHSIVWDGKDSNGKPVTSGLYFYRMCLHPDSSGKTDTYSKVRKMLLLR